MARVFKDFDKTRNAIMWFIMGTLEYEDEKDIKSHIDLLVNIENDISEFGIKNPVTRASNDYFRYRIEVYEEEYNKLKSPLLTYDGCKGKIMRTHYEKGVGYIYKEIN